ncbi:MAG: hypothetical protein H7A21_14295 [Spirochaetales bacterium]|nr:hypothetical protein [Leptospiraceae bacterium]MCP5482602.1 hypothetical protein [Spirochaetales bacterium]MCP5485191.1 hypothetical protein [Spirochaetales bacterium]
MNLSNIGVNEVLLFLLVISVALVFRQRYRALLSLEPHERARYLEAFRFLRMVEIVIYFLVLIVVWKTRDSEADVLNIAIVATCFLVIVGWLSIGFQIQRKKLNELEMPDEFITAHMLGRMTLLVMLGLLFLNVMRWM